MNIQRAEEKAKKIKEKILIEFIFAFSVCWLKMHGI